MPEILSHVSRLLAGGGGNSTYGYGEEDEHFVSCLGSF